MYLARLDHPADFDAWREAARTAVALGVPPEEMAFAVREEPAPLFADPLPERPADAPPFNVPKAFPDVARKLICHADPERFVFAYRLLWRLQAEKKLLEIVSDPDTRKAVEMQKAVYRDSHKMKAFVRFREIEDDEGQRQYIAWFEPFHHVVELTAPFFMRRFPGMIWSILTPKRSVHWDGVDLTFAPGAKTISTPSQWTERLGVRMLQTMPGKRRMKKGAVSSTTWWKGSNQAMYWRWPSASSISRKRTKAFILWLSR